MAADGVVAKVVDFSRPLVQLQIPSHLLGTGPVSEVSLQGVSGSGDRPEVVAHMEPPSASEARKATLIGPAPQVDVASQLAGYWYAVNSPPIQLSKSRGEGLWRPGLQVKALMHAPDPIPRAR